jgi:hypothetical protein
MNAVLENEDDKKQIKPICYLCGSDKAKKCAGVTSLDRWVTWTPAYSKYMTRFLCVKCRKAYSPKMSLSLEKHDKKTLRQFPIHDKNGNLLPSAFLEQLQLLPNQYPLNDLGDSNIKGILKEVIRIKDVQVLVLCPYKGQHYYMDKHMEMFGKIYIPVPYNRFLPYNSYLPMEVSFKSKYVTSNRKHTFIFSASMHLKW